MSLSLLQAYSAMALNCTMPFAGAGGTPPYTYSVQAGGVGGTIDASSGVYTSPNSVSTAAGTPLTDTVIVTDSTANTASGTILCGNILNLVVDIIQQGMGFSQDQVYVYNQKYLIPTDSRVYVAVGMLNSKPFSNGQAQPNGNGSGLHVTQSVNMKSVLSIYMLSRGPDALYLMPSLVMAMATPYAKAQQEFCSFSLFPISNSLVSVSQGDGAAIPYVFNMAATVQYFVTNTVPVNYYSEFTNPTVYTNS